LVVARWVAGWVDAFEDLRVRVAQSDGLVLLHFFSETNWVHGGDRFDYCAFSVGYVPDCPDVDGRLV